MGTASGLRPPLPGEVWRIDALEGHCLFAAFERLRGAFPEDDPIFRLWYGTLRVEEERYEQGTTPDTPHTEVTPNDSDRAFFEVLVRNEIASLAAYEDLIARCREGNEDEEESAGPILLLCAHAPHEHVRVLETWLEREIQQPKRFAASRAALATLPLARRLSGPPPLSRHDAERIIEGELERLRATLTIANMNTLEALDTLGHPPFEGYNRDEMVATLAGMIERTLTDAEQQLREILARRIVDDPPPIGAGSKKS